MTPDDLLLTPSVVRILRRVCRCDPQADLDEVTGQLVAACVSEESLAGGLLRSRGFSQEEFPVQLSEDADAPTRSVTEPTEGVALARLIPAFPENLSRIVAEARRIVRKDLRDTGLTSEHLLAATLRFDTAVCRQLQHHGITTEEVVQAASGGDELADSSLPVTFALEGLADEEDLNSSTAAQSSLKNSASPKKLTTGQDATGRVLDACLNRAREGLRVLEDYARFILDHGALVRTLKELRHRLATSEQRMARHGQAGLSSDPVAVDRDVSGDVGTEVTSDQERSRRQLQDIVHANARRVQESLRSLEEFGKLVSVEFAAAMKQLRYQAYTVHQELLIASSSRDECPGRRRERLQSAHLCVLLTESACRQPWQDVVRDCLANGADMIQLREKHLSDHELLARARWLADQCRSAEALAIVNDRVDIAQMSGADGVHLGQEDCTVIEARQLLGPDHLIGFSTHSTDDLSSEPAAAADYVGVGPVFSSVTKDFAQLAGLELVEAARSFDVPWFAIGGIGLDCIDDVVAAGASRIAVSSSVISAEQPGRVVRLLREALVAPGDNSLC